MKGHRSYMEDRVLCAAPLDQDSALHVFGVYDGHGGTEAAEFCQKNLPGTFVTAVAEHDKNVSLALKDTYNSVGSHD